MKSWKRGSWGTRMGRARVGWIPAGLALVSASLPCTTLDAQELPVTLVGSRVRIRTAARSSWLVGTARVHTRDSLVLEPSGVDAASVTVATGDILTLEVHRGRRGHWLLGAAIGAVVGSVGPFIWARATFCDARGRGDGSCGGADFLLAGIGFGAGGLVGAGVGALIQSDHWQPMRNLAGDPGRGAAQHEVSRRTTR